MRKRSSVRLLISSNGDVFFTGDHYASFVAVYLHSQHKADAVFSSGGVGGLSPFNDVSFGW